MGSSGQSVSKVVGSSVQSVSLVVQELVRFPQRQLSISEKKYFVRLSEPGHFQKMLIGGANADLQIGLSDFLKFCVSKATLKA